MNFYRFLQQRAETGRPIRLGVIGAGKFSSMFLSQVRLVPGMQVVGIAELDPDKARQICLRVGWPQEVISFGESTAAINEGAGSGKITLTDDSNKLIQADVDIILEITGIPEAGANHAWKALEAGKHVIMANAEADALLGAVIRKKADEVGLVYSMAYGDEPAIVCQLIDWAQTAGFEVVCAGKGTRHQPKYRYSTPETVWKYWGFSEEQVASGDYNAKMFNSFVDGTKSDIEMCIVANASGLIPQKCGLQFPLVGVDELPEILKPKSVGGILEHSGTVEAVVHQKRDGTPASRKLGPGVYVVFKAPSDYVRRCFTEYELLTDASGEYAALYRPFHLIGLELGVSVASVALRGEPTGSSRAFIADVASVAKKDLKSGDVLDGEGGYTVFGWLVRAEDSMAGKYLPMGLSGKAKVIRPVAKGTILTYDDVELDDRLFSYKLRKMMEKDSTYRKIDNY